jgi:hypothetical protein
MIERKKSKLKIALILLIFGIDLGIGSTPLLSSDNSNILKKNQKSNLSKINPSNQGTIDYSEQELFWFIHITDTQFVWSANDNIANFNQLLNETFKEIDPLFIYNTGDLVDANHGAMQDVDEWKLYKDSLDDNDMNSSIYIDLAGNHDTANDPNFKYYLNYSMIGRNFNTLQYSFNKSFSFGDYAFIGINTAKNSYNIYEFALYGFLNTTELDWYEKELEKYRNFDRIFVFGHHSHNSPPPYLIISNTSSSGKSFFELNEEYNVYCYLSGHVHGNTYRKDNNLLMMTTTNFDSNNGTYRIVTLDHNQLSTSIESVGSWPQTIITYPSSEYPLIQGGSKIRVLAWDPYGINSVKWSIHSIEKEFQITNWEPLINIDSDEPLWEGDLDVHLDGDFLLKIKVDGGSGSILKEIILHSKSDWRFNSFLLVIFVIIAMISITIVVFNYSKIRKPEFKIRKKAKLE